MEHRKFGKTDMSVSALGYGGAEIGFEGAENATVADILNAGLDQGLNVIDTAECYVDSEQKIGEAIAHRRDEFHLFTKAGHGFQGSNAPDWSIELLEASIDHSLKMLKTDHVDLLQLHSCSKEILETGEVIEWLQKTRDAGKTRYIGYSGDGDAAVYAVETGVFDSLQTSINVADQQILDLALPKAREAGMGVIAKRPVANVAWKTGDEENPNGYHQPYWKRLRELDYDFTKLSIDEAVGIALRFTLSQPGVSTAIVGTKSPGRWKTNAESLAAGPLSDAEIAKIRDQWYSVAATDWVGLT